MCKDEILGCPTLTHAGSTTVSIGPHASRLAWNGHTLYVQACRRSMLQRQRFAECTITDQLLTPIGRLRAIEE
jgi:hypothetical protein